MKVLIFGAAGMLGHKLYQRLGSQNDVTATIRGEFSSIERYGIFRRESIIENIDVREKASVELAIKTVRPDVVVNAVGVIKQLPSAKDVITTLEINAIFPHRLAEFGAKYGFRTISVSTDCVFDGSKGNYSEDDVPNAIDLYGKSKALGELAGANCLTLRTSIIGRELGTSHSLIDWFLSNRGGSVKGFTRAIYSGFPTIVFADIIGDLVANRPELIGLYQVASEPINKFELLKLVNDAYDANIEVVPESDFAIDRSLDASKFNQLTGFEPPSWAELVAKMAADTTEYDSFKQ